jgi:hypothetical protein
MRAKRSTGPFLLVAFVECVGACGSKSGLLDGVPLGAGGAGSGGLPSAGGGSGASAGFGAGGGTFDAGPDAPPPLPDCRYVPHGGEPIELFTYGDGVHTPSMARLAAGSPSAPARIGFGLVHEHFWHPDHRVAEVAIGPSWPDGVSVTHSMVNYGIDAHAPGQLVPATGSSTGLALFYFHADEASPNVIPGVKFRRFDTASWQPFDEVFVEKLSDYAHSIAPGPAVDGSGSLVNAGYGVTWRAPASTNDGGATVHPRVGILDELGTIVSGPVDIALPGPYPGVGATVAWTSGAYGEQLKSLRGRHRRVHESFVARSFRAGTGWESGARPDRGRRSRAGASSAHPAHEIARR